MVSLKNQYFNSFIKISYSSFLSKAYILQTIVNIVIISKIYNNEPSGCRGVLRCDLDI